MSRLAGLRQVALREIKERGRSRAYLITTVLTLLIVVGLVVVPQFFDSDSDAYAIGLVGAGNDQIIEVAGRLGIANDEPGSPPSVVIETTDYPDRESASAALDTGKIDAALVDGDELVVESVGGFGGSPIIGLLQRGAATVELERLVAESGRAAADVIDVMTSDPLETTSLAGGEGQEDSQTLVAYFGLLLLYIAVLLYGTWILSGVTEEKSNRVVEVLLATLRPWQLLGGKILGIGTLGMMQFAGTIIVGAVALQVTGAFDLPPIETATLLNLILWFILGFLLFAVMFGAAGSLVSRMEDAQNVAFPMSLTAIVGFFISIAALENPDSTLSVVGTFIPLTAPFVVPVRTALGAIPAWQFVAAFLLTTAAIVGMIFVAGRIYAGGLLRFGGKIGVREAWKGAGE